MLAISTALRHPLSRLLGKIAVVVLGLVGFAWLAISAIIQSYKPPGVWQNPPIYQGASDIKVADFGGGMLDPLDGTGDRVDIMKVITFTVSAPQNDVVSFYGRAFGGGGFEPEAKWGRTVAGRKDLDYSWTSPGRSPSVYLLDLVTTPLNKERTQVEIGASMFPGR